MQGPFNMDVSSTILLLTQGTTAKQWGQNIFEKAFEFLKPNDPIYVMSTNAEAIPSIMKKVEKVKDTHLQMWNLKFEIA